MTPVTLEKAISVLSSTNLGLVGLHTLVLTTAPGGIRMVDIAAQTKTSTANSTGTVDRLEKMGYVERVRDEQGDRRVVNVKATDSGKDLVSGLRDKLAAAQK